MTTYTDLKITDNDLELDSAGMPVFVHDREVIAQDIRHGLLDSSLLIDLIGERNRDYRKLIFKKIRMRIEADPRIKPGSSQITETEPGQLVIVASSEFGPITLGISQ